MPMSELTQIEELKNVLLLLQNTGTIESANAVIEEMTKKEFEMKEKKVLERHPNKITKTYVKRKNGELKEVYQTVLNGLRPRVNSYNKMIDLLYQEYFIAANKSIKNYSFSTIYKKALDKKIKEEHPKEKTIIDYDLTYRTLISEKLKKTDIRYITGSDLKIFMQDCIIENKLTQKRFLKMKTLINMVFDYATDPDIRILEINPVPQKNAVFKKNCRQISYKPEDKAFQETDVKKIQAYLYKRIQQKRYDIYGYAILLSSLTGMREGEIPALKWDDITENAIHIHAQQNDIFKDHKTTYYYNSCTKNEKGVSRDGRYFPLTDEIKDLLDILRKDQEKRGIKSEWIFAQNNGEWITTRGYYKSLRNVCLALNLNLTNNHALRMALNSYVLIPLGLKAPERARLLGHSVETNLKNYTFAKSDEYIDDVRKLLNGIQKQ